MSVYDNMAFGLELRKYPKAEIREARHAKPQASWASSNCLIAGQRPSPAGSASALRSGAPSCGSPEVFSSTNRSRISTPRCAFKCARRSRNSISAFQATMIYVTHDQIEAMTMGTRIVVMKDGVIQQVDSPLKIYNEPKNLFVAGFLGSPPMNLINGIIARRRTARSFSRKRRTA